MKTILTFALLMLTVCMCTAQDSSNADIDSTLTPHFHGVVNGKKCQCWQDDVANEIIQDVQNSIDCDSTQDALLKQKGNCDSTNKALQDINDIQKRIIDNNDSIVDYKNNVIEVKDIEYIKLQDKDRRLIYLLKVERVLYPILTAAAFVTLFIVIR